MSKDKPQALEPSHILVFDSGVGGLSVYQEIAKKLPGARYTYLFDNQAYPYGELAQDTLIERVTRLIDHIVAQKNIDLVVIACNTASTIVLPPLRQMLSIPVVGVVPAIKPASLISKKGVGLIATPATVTREYTHELIKAFSSDKSVHLLGSTQLVDMAEAKLRGQQVDLECLREIFKPIASEIDVAVLGCTHFPLLKAEIEQVLGKEIRLVDSGEAIARRVADLLSGTNRVVNQMENEIFASASPAGENALNEAVMKIGFSKIKTLPTQGV
ncbi:glutamate racemase [Vibrio sp. SCSIO 43136]|uniref:glutamate racemase n=1 Tax=Vibrio sp. SCSIO 43136 TaxID=2819101 RepID=UPI0020756F6B|nr:glutamate racemase [Vibrio sp. SCSIO 43136]USD65411.1 glutamate racemase [Vibrio sp. SCSIO 43136]